jgi:dGTPase
MVCDIIDYSWAARGDNIDSITEHPSIGMSPQILEATNNLREFLFDWVYDLRSALEEAEKAREVIRLLYSYFNEHEDKLPPEYRFYSDDTERRVVDYIAGMTDQYALRMAEEFSLTKGKAK